MLPGNQSGPLSLSPGYNNTVKPASGGGHAATDGTRDEPRDRQQKDNTGIKRIIRTSDREVPGYVFWPIIFGVGAIFQQVVIRL